MLRIIIRFGLFLLVALVGYNYFYGTAAEKEQSKEIIDTTKSFATKTFKSVGKLLKAEKEKFNDGRHDEAMAQLNDVFKELKTKAKTESAVIRDEFKDLELDKTRLEEELAATDQEDVKKIKALKAKFENLTDKTKAFIDKIKD